MIDRQLLAIIQNYEGQGYFKYGNIPAHKLQNAIQHYPVDPTDTIIAIVDSTLLGSAKHGAAIGLKGVYWRTGYNSDRNFIDWGELAALPTRVSVASVLWGTVQLAPGCIIQSTYMGLTPLANLLNQIVDLYRSLPSSAVVVDANGRPGSIARQNPSPPAVGNSRGFRLK